MSSYGVACFRHIPGNGYEVILMKRRYTYEFRIFVYGDYKYNGPNISMQYMSSLLSRMTVDEKLLIMTWDFNRLWYKIWLTDVGVPDNLREKFENMYNAIGKTVLVNMIESSASADTIWELPKGRMDTLESEVECANREFVEETGIPKHKYNLFIDEYIRLTMKDMGSHYNMKFWASLMRPDYINEPLRICTSTSTSTGSEKGAGSCHEHDSIKYIPVRNLADYVPSYLLVPINTLCMRLKKRLRSTRFKTSAYSDISTCVY